MAAVAPARAERRAEPRVTGGGSRWNRDAVLRPGLSVIVLNMSRRGALVESEGWLRPGARTELQLTSTTTKVNVKGRLDRCVVSRLEPLRYRGVVLFETSVDLE